MKRRYATWTLALHAALLLLASTRFSAVTWLWGDRSWSWDYFQYSCRNGWGYQYQSDYSLAVVVAYIGAYLIGTAGFVLAWNHVAGVWKSLGLILAALGLASFLIEGSHWLWSHNFSWICVCPAANLLPAGVAIVQLNRPNKSERTV